jgi:hypothetical protein
MFNRLAMRSSLGRLLVLVMAATFAAALLVAPALASGTRQAAPVPNVTYTRATSCYSLNFHPIDNTTVYDYQGNQLIRTGAGGSGFFLCDPHLPQGAVVTKVQFTLYDNADDGNVQYCGLNRAGLTIATMTSYQTLADVAPTGLTQRPGEVRRSTSTIHFATVDNTKYSYWLQCHLDVRTSSFNHGIFGADVVYQISATNG